MIFFNMCIDTRVFPADRLKVARIIQERIKSDISNHRPISLLSTNKIYEFLINCRLKKILNRQNILCSNQFGFHIGKSTELAALELVERVAALRDKYYAKFVF